MWTERLLLPGPTPVPERVAAAQMLPMTNHRGEEFGALMEEVRRELKALMGEGTPIVLPSSGTGGLGAVLENLLLPGDSVLVQVSGFFGERFAGLAEARGCRVTRMDLPWDRPADPAEVARKAGEDTYQAVLLTQNETSTGVLHPIREIAERLLGGPLVLIDAISGFPSIPLGLDTWGVDAVVACSQKGFMVPPGISMTWLSERAVARARKNPSRKGLAYFDFVPYLDGQLPYTAPVGLVRALRESLALMNEEGAEERYARHRLLSRMSRAFGEAAGMTPVAPAEAASPTVTALRVPKGQADALTREARRLGLLLGGGLGRLKGEAIRVGHVGYVLPADLLGGLGLIEVVLGRLGLAGEGATAAAIAAWRRADQEAHLRKGGPS